MRKLLRCLASLRFPWLLLASTPAFAVEPSTIETAASHLEKNTNTYLILLAALGPILALVGAALFVVRYIMPVWQTEQKATRDQREAEGEKTRQHIAEDREAARLLADEQHKRLVDSISGKVEKLHEDVKSIGRRTGEIAVKLGVPSLLLCLVFCGPALTEQVRLHQLADRSTADCKTAAPAAKVSRCNLALLCAKAAQEGTKAIQSAQEARAGAGATAGQEAVAHGSYAAAIATCKHGGWQ